MKNKVFILTAIIIFIVMSNVNAAYHHEDEKDGPRFQSAYPERAGTKLDDCSLCHTGNTYTTKRGDLVRESSCDYCHKTYGYDASGNIVDTLNPYGLDYGKAGRSESAFSAIENKDSDGDGYTNIDEINAVHYPGYSEDDPSMNSAPSIEFTLEEIEEMAHHAQFMLLNATRQNDLYVEYEGIILEDLLEEAGMIKDNSTSITVYSPDGYSKSFPLESEGTGPYVNGQYPEASFWYDEEADLANGGWCDYSATGCTGRLHGDPLTVDGGLWMLLTYKRNGAYLESAFLSEENKIQGEGPFRVVPPQWLPGYPDQGATSDSRSLVWTYDADEIYTSHNSGNSPKASAAIRIDPMPEGTIEPDWRTLETDGGWDYINSKKIIIFGNIKVSSDIDDSGDDAGDDSSNTDNSTSECPVESVSGAETIGLFRMFRDSVLKKNPAGKNYINMYYDFAPEVTGVIMTDGKLRRKFIQVIAVLKPVVRDVLQDKQVVVTQAHRKTVCEFIEMLKTTVNLELSSELDMLENEINSGNLMQELMIKTD